MLFSAIASYLREYPGKAGTIASWKTKLEKCPSSNLVGGVAASSEYYQEILPNPTDMLMARSIHFAA